MINAKYQPWLNEVGRQFMVQQAQLLTVKRLVVEVQKRETPFIVAFSEVVSLWRTTLSVRNLPLLSVLSWLSKLAPFCQGNLRERILHRHHSRRLSPQHLLLYDYCLRYQPFRELNNVLWPSVLNEKKHSPEQGQPIYQ